MEEATITITKEEAEIVSGLLLNARITGSIQELPKMIEKLATLSKKYTDAFLPTES